MFERIAVVLDKEMGRNKRKLLTVVFRMSRDKATMLGGSVTTAWCVLRLRMEERPPAIEGSCEYIE
jgi:hypothetical protein